ncbi:hypothetical protein [Lysobacter enzymogenes]|uniref:hypothetical protein n=1 Tax=Lysobacter enzymogenes TaxID=69 RepID=UPI001A96AD50|nr:hypothetical protein [Lysobacter enzymogenes]QQP94206.1 hypothetical protein JHW38_13065 [Lysobacter enzymogenes]
MIAMQQIGHLAVSSHGLNFNRAWTITPGPPLTMTANAGAALWHDQLSGLGEIRKYAREIPEGLKVYFQGEIALIPNMETVPPTDNPLVSADGSSDGPIIAAGHGSKILYGREFTVSGAPDVETAIVDGVVRMTATRDAWLTTVRLTQIGPKEEFYPLASGDTIYVCGSYISLVRK